MHFSFMFLQKNSAQLEGLRAAARTRIAYLSQFTSTVALFRTSFVMVLLYRGQYASLGEGSQCEGRIATAFSPKNTTTAYDLKKEKHW